jgi:predicted acyl esterase
MAALGPEGLATMIPNMNGADAHESSVRHGGALELRFLVWALMALRLPARPRAAEGAHRARVSAPSSASGMRKFTWPSERKQPRQSWFTTT